MKTQFPIFLDFFILKQKVRCPNPGFLDFLGFLEFFIFGLLGARFSNPTIGIKSYEDYLILRFRRKVGFDM